jgi:hypothetical protein
MRFYIVSIALMIIANLLSNPSAAQARTQFGQETQVNYGDSTGWETYQDMAVDSNGNLYLVWEAQPLTGANKWLSIWSSNDAGLSWQQIGYLYNPDADLTYPSIAVGEGNLNRLLVAYVVEVTTSHHYLEVACAPLGTGNFVISTPPDIGMTSRLGPPKIWTDASQMNAWRAYVTCTEYDFEGGCNCVVTWRSDPYASAWQSKKEAIFGNLLAIWSRPHAAFGTPSKRSFIICCLSNTRNIKMVYTDDFGATYSDPVTITILDALPQSAVDPQIAAARDYHNLVVCFCERAGDYDELMYIKSLDAGSIWHQKDRIPGWGSFSRFGPELAADTFEGHGFHLTYTRQEDIFHHYLRPDLVGNWSDLSLVCGSGHASHVDTKKGLACHPETNAAFVCWCDTRDGSFDSDTFFCYSGSLVGTKYKLSAGTGGSSFLFLDAGEKNAYRNYLILGGITGTKPGTSLPGGHFTLPINWDLFTDLALNLLNTTVFCNFYDVLDHSGSKEAALHMPSLDPIFIGVVMNFAYCLNQPFNFVSNPIAVEIVN